MRAFFDTSWLVAAMDANEVHHPTCLKALDEHGRTGSMALHSLGECFATLTGKLGFGPEEAAELIKVNCVGYLQIIALTTSEYMKCIMAAQTMGIRGGAIYDALLLQAARKAGVEKIYTLNARHFAAFAPDMEDRITGP